MPVNRDELGRFASAAEASTYDAAPYPTPISLSRYIENCGVTPEEVRDEQHSYLGYQRAQWDSQEIDRGFRTERRRCRQCGRAFNVPVPFDEARPYDDRFCIMCLMEEILTSVEDYNEEHMEGILPEDVILSDPEIVWRAECTPFDTILHTSVGGANFLNPEFISDWLEQRDICSCETCYVNMMTHGNQFHRQCAAWNCTYTTEDQYCGSHVCNGWEDADEGIRCPEQGVEFVDGASFCTPHANDIRLGRRYRLHNYGHKPEPVFWGFPTNDLYLGLELECEAHGDYGVSHAVRTVRKAFDEDEFYCKADSSLHNGLEIVSHPRSLESWQELESRFGAMLQQQIDDGIRAWDANDEDRDHMVGIHIHASKAALRAPVKPLSGRRPRTRGVTGDMSSRHTYMLQMLVYGNKEQMRRYVGRNASYGSLNLEDLGRGRTPVGMSKSMRFERHAGYQTNRGMAINFQPDFTVEFRMFRSSLNINRVLGNLEFVHALIEYSRMVTFADFRAGALQWDRFLEWLMANPKYPHSQSILARASKHVDTNA